MKALCLFCALLVLTGCGPRKQDYNRYKIITEGPVMLKLDTSTGQTWRWVPDYTGNSGSWKQVQTEP